LVELSAALLQGVLDRRQAVLLSMQSAASRLYEEGPAVK
jgi:hypothetical protein